MELRLGAYRMPTLEELKVRVNKATASITNDYQPQEEVKDPKPVRAICRFLLTLVVGGTLVVVIALLAMIQPDTTMNRVIYETKEYEILSAENKTCLCPCSSLTGISWTTFINVSMIKEIRRKEKKELNTTQVDYTMMHNTICNMSSTFQDYEDYEDEYKECHDIVSTLFFNKDDRNSVQTVYLLSPTLLSHEATLQMTSKVLHTLQLYAVREGYNSTPRSVARSFAAMLDQYKWKPSSTVKDFWKASQKTRKLWLESSNYAFKMELDWHAYEAGCAPKYCDVIQPNSMKSKVFRAMADFGGFSSVVLFALRTFLWPSLKLFLSKYT